MARVSVSEAARLVGMSRQNLYSSYIATGKLSVERDGEKPPKIDTSELLRVFGSLKGEEAPAIEPIDQEIAGLRRLLSERDAQLAEAREREAWLKNHLSEVTGALRLLENKTVGQDERSRLVQRNKELVAQANKAIRQLALERDALLQRGFWARLFNV